MPYSQFTFQGIDNYNIVIHKWVPDAAISAKAVLVIIHGMAEHGYRYNYAAEKLVSQGVIVYAPDLRGHGKTAGTPENTGLFPQTNGWFTVAGDIMGLVNQLKQTHNQLPLFLMGHSMGSFFVRTCISMQTLPVKGIILSGTSGEGGVMVTLGKILSNIIMLFKGRNHPSGLLDKLSFGKFSDQIKNPVTKFDWLSTDTKEVQKYVDDPFCGRVFSAGFFHNLFSGITFINKTTSIQAIPKNLSIYFFAGKLDPVGNFGKGVEKVVNSYLKAGLTQVSLKLYDGGRHEMLNEVNKDEVIKDLANWIFDQK